MSRTLWLLAVMSVIGRTVAQNQFFPEGHGLIDGSYVKIREEIAKDYRLLAGGGSSEDGAPSVLSQSWSALPTLTTFLGGQPFESFSDLKNLPSLSGLNKKTDCTDCIN